MGFSIRLLVILSLLFIASGFTYPPKPTGGVSDFASVVPAREKAVLDQRLHDFYEKTGHMALVAIFSDLDGLSIEEVATELFKRWGVGAKKESDGALLILAMKERGIRIETGYGLEERLTDLKAARMIRYDIKPWLKQGAYARAIDSFTEQMEILFPEKILPRKHQEKAIPQKLLIVLLAIAFFGIIWIIQLIDRMGSGRSIRSGGGFNSGWGAGPGIFGGGGRSGGSSSGGSDWFSGGGGLSGGGGASDSW